MSRANGRGRQTPRKPQIEPGTPAGDDIGLSARQDPAGSPIPGLTGNVANYETVRREPAVGESFDEFRGMMAHGVPNASETTEERATMERTGTLAQHRPPTPPELHREARKPIPIPVYLVEQAAGGSPLTTLAGQKISVPAQGNAAARIGARDLERTDFYIMAETVTVNAANPTPSQPSVPATGVAQQNPNSYPVQVVISANGATITNVSVNGITAGTAAGTYVVPAYGAISIAYSVATPTWVWSYDGPQTTAAAAGIRISHELGDLDVGLGALIKPGSYQRLNHFQDELFAVSADSNAQVVSIITIYEIAAGS